MKKQCTPSAAVRRRDGKMKDVLAKGRRIAEMSRAHLPFLRDSRFDRSVQSLFSKRQNKVPPEWTSRQRGPGQAGTQMPEAGRCAESGW